MCQREGRTEVRVGEIFGFEFTGVTGEGELQLEGLLDY